jgi:hypothetical protein
MNVDGDPGNVQEDVLVLANDSIYVFAEVTVDPISRCRPVRL